MEQPSHSRRRLGPFLLNILKKGETPGTEWYDRSKKEFRILWNDKRSSGKDQNPIFKKWEIHNKRFAEGDVENWSKWKQTFRNALNKSPDVKAVPELYQLKDTSTPFRVYQFVDSVCLEKHSSSSPGKRMSVPSPKRCERGLFHQEIEVSMEAQGPFVPCNIPEVVTDVLRNINDNFTHSAADIFPPNNAQNVISTEQIKPLSNVLSEANDIPQNCHLTAGNEFRMDSDEFASYFRQHSSMDTGSIPSFNTPNDSLLEQDKPLVKFQVYYSNVPVFRTEKYLSEKGARLFFGPEPLIDLPNVFGPKEYDQVELPDVLNIIDGTNGGNDKMIRDIQSVLEQMNRGLLLHCIDKKPYALRLCAPHVYVWNKTNGSFALDRKRKTWQPLFDMNIFKEKLDLHKSDPRNNACPSSTVFLTFGQRFDLENAVGKKLKMYLELTYLEAEELLQKELPIPQDIQFSGFDSGDELVQRFYESLNLTHSVCP